MRKTITAMSQFTPINDDHAVESVGFQIFFNGVLGSDAIMLAHANHHLWREELPALQFNNLEGIDAGAGPFPAMVSFSYLRPDGTPAWQLRFEAQSVTVVCGRYTRWDKVWSVAQSLLKRALTAIVDAASLAETKMVGIKLQVADKFEVPEEYWSPDGPLGRDSGYLPPMVFGVGPIWHNNTGWFEQYEAGPILHLLNSASVRNVDDPSVPLISLTVTHLQEARLLNPISISPAESSFNAVEAIMSHFHSSNKALISSMLVDEMRTRIGLQMPNPIEVTN